MSYGWGAVIGMALILMLVAWYVVRRFRVDRDDVEGSLGTLVAPVVLSLYLLVVAVAVVIGWDNNDGARDLTTQEATAATDLYWTATTVDGTSSTRLRHDIRDYLTAVVEHDWRRMPDGDLSEQGDAALRRLRGDALAVPGNTEREVANRALAIQQVNDLARMRAERAADSGPSIPLLLTLTTAILALAVIVLPLAAYARGSSTNLLWNVLMTVMVAGSVFIVLAVNNAYSGPFAVSPSPLRAASHGFAAIDQAASHS